MEIDKVKLKQQSKELEIMLYKSNYNFLLDHRGFRPGSVHTFLAKSGQGKSTLMRSMLKEICKENKVLVWLSEETETNMQVMFYEDDMLDEEMQRITVIDELSLTEKTQPFILQEVLRKIKFPRADILILDNISTSMAKGDTIPEQALLINKLKWIATEYNIPVVIFVHTKTNLNESRLLEDDDIKGYKLLSNMSDYFYAIQMFQVDDNKHQTIRTIKSRYHDQALGKFYRLRYNKKMKCYDKDTIMDFDEFRAIWKRRNKL